MLMMVDSVIIFVQILRRVLGARLILKPMTPKTFLDVFLCFNIELHVYDKGIKPLKLGCNKVSLKVFVL